jgi:5-methyltetrahydropteroyltriglutamate--homocysteine methyltransferase
MPGPMTIVDTIADRHYGDKVKLAMAFADLLNQEARALEKDGVDVIQFDEPAFNVYMDDVTKWGIAALHRAISGLEGKTACTSATATASRPTSTGRKRSGGEWRQYEEIFPALAKSKLDQVRSRCIHSKVPVSLLGLLKARKCCCGVSMSRRTPVETPAEVAATIGQQR